MDPKSSRSFYRDLKGFADRGLMTRAEAFVEVPPDWHVVLSDVRASTAAIRAGKYKEVNLAGASSIMAAMNVLGAFDFPYSFGGDGATLLVHDQDLPLIKQAMLGARQRAREAFDLDLRVGSVSVRELAEAGVSLRVAKYASSPTLSQAMFTGGALAKAELLIKHDEARLWRDEVKRSHEALFEGLECRWQPVAARGKMLSVIVRATQNDSEKSAELYREIIARIESTVGDPRSLNPVTQEKLRVTVSPMNLMAERKMRTAGATFAGAFRYQAKIWLQAVFGRVAMHFDGPVLGFNWRKYRRAVEVNTDFWKYDEMLRFVIDVSAPQEAALRAYFDELTARGEIHYGIHASDEALMTCLVFRRQDEHVHFVDGGAGGYALAAEMMKGAADAGKEKGAARANKENGAANAS